MKARRRGIWQRRHRWGPDALRPLGILGDSRSDVAGIRSAVDRIDAYAWTSYGGWWTDADGVARRGWVQSRPIKGPTFLLQLFAVLGSGMADRTTVSEPGGGWLNVEVRPHLDGPGSTVEIRGDVDAELEESIRRAIRGMRLTVTRTWDPTVP